MKKIDDELTYFKAIIDNLPFEVWFKDTDGNYRVINKYIENNLGEPRTYIIGKNDYELYPNYADKYVDTDHAVIKGDLVGYYDTEYKEGIYEEYKTPVFDETSKLIGTTGFSKDVTKFRKTQKALRESEERFRTIFEEAPVGIGIFDSVTGKAYQINSRFAEIIGRTIDEIMSLSWEQYTYPDDLQENQYKMSLLNSNKVSGFSIDKRFIKPDGKVIWANVTVTPFEHRDNIETHLCMLEDITERKQVEELRIRKDALEKIIEMKDEFLSNISHEFKTPLNVILSALQILDQIYKEEFSDKPKCLLNKIRQNSYRQLRLVNNLLDITRANTGQFKIKKTNKDIVSLTRAITDSIEIYAEQRGIKLEFSSAIKRKEIAIDEDLYERIMLNLLSNAIKFSNEGKTILVKLGQKLVNSKTFIYIQVIDQGIGIPGEKIDLIFEKFGQVDHIFTRQKEGTGIGLSLVKMFVELLNGTISVDSELGFGSTFSILLPMKKVKELKNEQEVQIINDRLINGLAVEFSDIYSGYFYT